MADGAAAEVVSLPPEIMAKVESLHTLQEEYIAKFAEYVAERKALEQRFAAQYAEVFRKRKDVIVGAAETGDAKGIPNFWLQAMQNNRLLCDFIEEQDIPALEKLEDISYELLDDANGFKLVFTFAANDFFSDTTLTKSFIIPNMLGGDEPGSEPAVQKLVGSEIHWKAGKCLTESKKKVTKKVGGKKKTVEKTEPVPSFFRFFDTPDMDALEADALGAEESMALIELINAEIEVGFTLRNKIIPSAVKWFTGEAEDDEDDEDDEYDEEDEDDDEDDDEHDDDEDEDEDEDEDDEDEDKPKGKGGKAGAKGGKPSGKGGKGKKKDDDDDEEDGAAGGSSGLADAFSRGANVSGGDGAAGGQECKQQ